MSEIEVSSSGSIIEVVNNEVIIEVSQTGSPGIGIPAGGETGQVLAKASDTNYDTEWVDTAINSVTMLAGQTISALRIVYTNTASKLFYADKDNLNTISTILGVTTTSGLVNNDINVLTAGVLQDDSWSWNMAANLNLFLGTNGAIVQGMPVGAASVRIGNVVSPTEILIRIGQSVLTAN